MTFSDSYDFTATFKKNNGYNESFEHVAAMVNTICDTGKTYEVCGLQPNLTDVNAYSEYGFGSMGRTVGFPAPFVKQLCAENPMLGKNVIADRIQKYFEKGRDSFFVREFEGKICGAVSNKYAYFDDNQVCDIIAGSDIAKLTYKTALITPERLHLRAIDFDNPFRLDGDDSELYFAFFVDNSMVGASAFKVQLGVYRLACTNGLIVPVKECIMCKQVHRGSKDIAEEFNGSIEFLKKKKETIIQLLTDSATQPSAIEEMKEEFKQDYLAKKLKTTAKESKKIFELYQGTYGGGTKWALTNAITEFARDVKDVDRREFLERRALMVA